MVKKVKAFVLSSTIVAMLLFSAFGTITVYADGSGTKATDAEATGTGGEEEQPSGDQKDVVDQSGDGGSQPAEPATVDAAPPTGEAKQEETVAAPEPVLEKVPDNTTVKVLDQKGETLPLVTQEAANTIESDSDPIWCPAGQAPTPGANGCTATYGSFNELLTFLQANEGDVAYQQAGTIYIQQGQYVGGESSIDFNNYGFTTLNNYSLLLQGGWDTTDNSVDPADTTSFNVPIIIGSSSNPWIGSLTLNNINISGASSQAGLTLFSQGDITLSNVEVTDSQSGADLHAGDEVIVSNSDFNNNENGGAHLEGTFVQVLNSTFNENGSGLAVVSTDDVTLSNVTANANESFGADIQGGDAVNISNGFFNGNQSFGLQIVTPSEVSLVNVEAEGNHSFGAHIEGLNVAIDSGRFSNNGSGDFNNLTGRGLEVISQFSVALANVTANSNELFGANIVASDLVAIERSFFDGNIVATAACNVKGAGTQGGYGLRVVTLGDIALEDVSASNNYLYGAYLQGDDTTVEGNLTRSFFVGNGSGSVTEPSGQGYGLQVVSTGSVSLLQINSADSAGNQLFGADINAAEDVVIVDAFFSRNQSVTVSGSTANFFGYGLTVVTPDDISLDQVVANFNNLWGASLTGADVTIANSQFNNNISDSRVFIDDTGLIVNASGYVDLYRVEARENRLIGATITAAGPVFIAESNFSDNRGFTCPNNRCTAKNMVFHGFGLQVTTPSLIMVTMTNVSGNNLFGAQLNGGEVTVTDSTFNDNRFGDGLTITATDNVTLTNITAVNNGGDGADVTGVCGKIVQVTGGTFTDNDLYGIAVVNSTLNLDGSQVFANNGSGNVFTDTGTCVVMVPASLGLITSDPRARSW